jgi:hypothetical protein
VLKAQNTANVKGQSTISFKITNNGEGGTKELAIRTYSPKRIRLALAKMIILDELPFRFVNKVGFQLFMSEVEPRFTIPSRVTVSRDCIKKFKMENKELKNVLKDQRVCLTTET